MSPWKVKITLENKFKGNAERGKETFFQIVSSSGQQEAGSQEQKPQQSPAEADKKPTNYLPWIIGGIAIAGVVVIGTIWLMSTHKNNKKRKISKQT